MPPGFRYIMTYSNSGYSGLALSTLWINSTVNGAQVAKKEP